jgi:glutamine synthetase
MIAAGLHGIDSELELEPAFEGNAYESDKPRVATNLAPRARAVRPSEVAREAFGSEVVDHYLNRARIELEASEAAVTDWSASGVREALSPDGASSRAA